MDELKRASRVGLRLARRYRAALTSHAYVIGGLGRCGTTLLDKVLLQHGMRPAPDFITDFDAVAEYQTGTVYKTHARPPASLPDHVKVLFMFGNPMDIAISVHRKMNEWGRQHHKHLNSDRFVPNDLVFEEDSLLLSRSFDAWYQPHSFEFLAIKYENLWDLETRQALDDYLGFRLKLPPQRTRKADWTSHPRKEDLERVYGELAKRVSHVPPFTQWPPIDRHTRPRNGTHQ